VSGDGTPRVSVVIVSWNGADDVAACLASVSAPGREVIVVDNASSDGSADIVRTRFPDAVLLRNPANLGFARAANRGLAAARAESVLFLNPDARANDGAIDAALGVLAERPDVGLVSVAVRDEAGALVPTVEPFFSLGALVRSAGRGRATAPAGPGPVAVDWCHGAFLLGRRDQLRALGGFDERFFLYAEDMDLCLRMYESGRSVVYLPRVAIVHRGNASGAVLLGERRPAAIFASQLAFYERRRGRAAVLALRAAAALFFGARAAALRATGSARAGRYAALCRVAALGPEAGPLASRPVEPHAESTAGAVPAPGARSAR